MKILIIEDSELKRKDIERFLKENFPDADVTTAASYSSGLRKAYKGEFDVVILDNSLPYYEDRPSSAHSTTETPRKTTSVILQNNMTTASDIYSMTTARQNGKRS